MRTHWQSLFLAVAVGLAETDIARADVELEVISVSPARAHLVAAGTSTTFVIAARNTGTARVSATFRVQATAGAPGDWPVLLAAADPLFRAAGAPSESLAMDLGPSESARLLVRVSPGPALAEGEEGTALVRAWTGEALQDAVELRSVVRNRPKIYYVAVDGLGPNYLTLNRRGALFDGTERLMPRATAFAARSARMMRASAVLPAVTDPNHSAALSGSWAGTLGIYAVRTHYLGPDEQGEAVVQPGSRGLLRWGAEGRRIETVFDTAKDPAAGGTPSAFNAVVSGKNWLAELLRDPALDLVAHGNSHPGYIPAPQAYRLGDPPSDPDAEQDREGTNLGPRLIKHLFSPERQLFEGWPGSFPEDRWVAEAAIRVIQAEDPDVLYVNLADTDTAQHVFGAADRPGEWDDRGTPAVLWDDEHVYNRQANRDPVLDVVHEADLDFGLIADTLASRQTLDRSFVVLYSDHGLNTVANTAATVLDPGRILLDLGVAELDVEWVGTWGEAGFLALRDPASIGRVQALLEAYEVQDPVRGTMVKPFLVVDRDEMDSGIDGVEGRFTTDGLPGNRRGALYSEWSIDQPSPDQTKVRWPDLFFFTRRPFHTVPTRASLDGPNWAGLPFQGDHGSSSTADVVLAASGPGIRPGVYISPASLTDIAPTLYRLLGVAAPANVDGRVLDEILDR
jgi:predicted AlkP superfamily pyrophosphatase or phosphodiesterase